MKLKLIFGDALCYTPEFEINDIRAYKDDFGEQYDRDEENAEEYGCGDMHFTPKLPTQEILNKYKITLSEYNEICKQLEDGLSFGSCGWCI